MKKVGLLTCANTTQELDCSSYACLRAINRGTGEFTRYNEDGGAELAGIISCAGCPTLLAPEKVLRKVRSLAVLGVDAIHFSFCMLALCPFKNKYNSLIEKEFPEINVVMGSHDVQPENAQMFMDAVKDMLGQPRQSMADLAERARAKRRSP